MTRFHATLAALAVATLLPAGASQAQTSYPLICRPGGGMAATVTAGQIRVSFTPGNTAAMPGAGQCVWIDRGFRAGEPAVLLLTGDAAGARYFTDAVFANTTFYAHVYNNGSGAMVVTRVGP
jgi:hypothetical protein